MLARHIARPSRCRVHQLVSPLLSCRGLCAGPSLELYHAMASVTVDGIQEVYEDDADEAPQQQMDVECAVRCATPAAPAHIPALRARARLAPLPSPPPRSIPTPDRRAMC